LAEVLPYLYASLTKNRQANREETKMKPSNFNSSFSVSTNPINRSTKREYALAPLLALALCLLPTAPAMAQAGLLTASPSTAQSTGGVLINNFNNYGVQAGLTANMGTMFTLAAGAQTYNI
jgi:hypothetical protein